MKLFFSLSFLFLHVCQAHALHLHLEPGALSDAEKAAVQTFIDSVQNKLPPKIKDSLTQDIAVRFGDTAVVNSINLSTVLLPAIVRGEAEARSLNEEFGLDIRRRVHHENAYRYAEGQLIRKIAVLYDNLNLQNPDERSEIRRCRNAGRGHEQGGQPVRGRVSRRCRLYAGRDTTISTNPNYMNRSNWVALGLRTPERSNANYAAGRSPDVEEMESPQKSFAVNLDFFLLDPNYSCRRPLLSQFFTDHFGFTPPSQNANCTSTNMVQVTGSYSTGTGERLYALDRSRLYEAHFFLAGPGPEIQTRWGHSMLRLVFCAPSRATVGPDCRKDYQYHMIVSYRAMVTDLAVDYMGQVTGRYPSMLYVMSLPNILDEYRMGELREIFSMPLRFNRVELDRLYDAVIAGHWDYEGRYRFLTNNCATETMNILKTATDYREHRAYHEGHVVIPASLRHLLVDTGMVDASPYRDLEQAKRDGLYFPSWRPFLLTKYKYLHEHFGQFFRDSNMDHYLEKTNAIDRAALFEHVTSDIVAVGAMAQLEKVIWQRLGKKIMKERMKGLVDELRRQRRRGNQHFEQEVAATHSLLMFFATPAQSLPQTSYGGPLSEEVSSMKENAELSGRRGQMKTGFERLEEATDRFVSQALVREREQSRANKMRMGGMLTAPLANPSNDSPH